MKLRTFAQSDLSTWFVASESLSHRRLLLEKFIEENTVVQSRPDLVGWLTRGIPNASAFRLVIESFAKRISYDAPAGETTAQLSIDASRGSSSDTGILAGFLDSDDYRVTLTLAQSPPKSGTARELVYVNLFESNVKSATEIRFSDRYWQWNLITRKGAFWMTERLVSDTKASTLVFYTTSQNFRPIPGVDQGDRWMDQERQRARTLSVMEKLLKKASDSVKRVDVVILPTLAANHPRVITFKYQESFSVAMGIDVGADLFSNENLASDGIVFKVPLESATSSFNQFASRAKTVARFTRLNEKEWASELHASVDPTDSLWVR